MSDFLAWFLNNYPEIIGTILALLSLYFQTIQNKWLWPFGIISSAIFAIIFYKAGIYADMGLQLYYVFISIYGWYYWIKTQANENSEGQIKSIFKMRFLILIIFVVTLAIFLIISQFLIYYTNSTVPYIDAFITALSITATWMLAKKYLEHWLVWIIVDAVSIAVYYYKELYVTIILYVIYTIFAIVGYNMWLNNYRKNKINLLHNNSFVC
jgi:nicotinamide mononucleotide transporter